MNLLVDANASSAEPENRAISRFAPKMGPSLLLWLILGFFVVILIWAALTEIDRTVRGMGRVVPSSKMQVISNLEGGIVQEVLVRTGQTVKAGDTLVRLDPTQSGGEFGSGSATVAALSAKIERLRALITGQTPRFSATGPSAEIERALYRSQLAELSSLRSAGEARLAAAQRSVAEAQSQYAARRAAATSARAELDSIRPLVERGIEPRLVLTQAIGRADAAASEAAAASATIARAQAGTAEARAAMSKYRIGVRAPRQSWLRLRRIMQRAVRHCLRWRSERNVPRLSRLSMAQSTACWFPAAVER
jgi:membrane fusion protein, adhesin transport system